MYEGEYRELLFKRCIVEEFFNEVHVREQHPPTTVALQAQSIQRITAWGQGGWRSTIRLYCLLQNI